jgi:hypothetical protein|tara:strand:+ start:302 stop:757 length:456 start_codon:yes stop_codon:yes gene_type:complete
MRGFYNVTTKIKESLLEDDFCKTVVFGNASKVDLNKQSLFPLANFVITNAVLNGAIWTFSIELSCADIVDISKEDVVDNFTGNDNEQDVLNTQLSVIGRLMERLNRGDIREELYQLNGQPTLTPFTGKLEMMLAGWTATFSVDIPSDISIC